MQEVPRRSWWKGLFGKYVLSFVGLILLLLLLNGVLETWFLYRETTHLLSKSLSEKAEATSRRIEQFVSELERQISWATRASATTIEERRSDYALLLQQVPAIDRLVQLDGMGKEQLRLTRTELVLASGIDYSGNPRFTQTQAQPVWVSAVYFDGLDPYLTIAMRHSGRNAGSTVAEINLKFLSSFIETEQIGKDNSAYVLDPSGRLLAHSDSSRPLGTDLSTLPQVAAMAQKAGAEPLQFGTGYRRTGGLVRRRRSAANELARVFRAAPEHGAAAGLQLVVPYRLAPASSAWGLRSSSAC